MRHTQRYIVAPLLVILSLFVVGCASMDPSRLEGASFVGMIYGPDNNPVRDARVSISEDLTARTDINGRFVVDYLPFGEYQATVSAELYETRSVDIAFLSETQVLYVRLVSFDSLIDEASDAIALRTWDRAENFLSRASTIHDGHPIIAYQRAVIEQLRGNHETALSYLDPLIQSGVGGTYVSRLAVDALIALERRDEALVLLRDLLTRRDSLELRRLIEELEGVEQ